jgi:hypothetical protein
LLKEIIKRGKQSLTVSYIIDCVLRIHGVFFHSSFSGEGAQ